MCNFLPTMAVLRGSWASPVLGPGGHGPIGVWGFFWGVGDRFMPGTFVLQLLTPPAPFPPQDARVRARRCDWPAAERRAAPIGWRPGRGPLLSGSPFVRQGRGQG